MDCRMPFHESSMDLGLIPEMVEELAEKSQWLFCGAVLDYCNPGFGVPSEGLTHSHWTFMECGAGRMWVEARRQSLLVLDPTGYELEENEHYSHCPVSGSASLSPLFTYIFWSSSREISRWDPSGCMTADQVHILSDLQHSPQFCGQMFGNVCFPKAAIHLSLYAANIYSVHDHMQSWSEQMLTNIYKSHLKVT